VSQELSLFGTRSSTPAVHVGDGNFKALAREDFPRAVQAGGREHGEGALFRFSILHDNYAYLLVCGREAIVVDPGEAEPMIDFLRENRLSLTYVLLTHHHADHAGGCPALKRATGCTVIGPQDPRIPGIDRPMKDGGRMTGEAFDVTALRVPGHTRTHLAYVIRAGAASFLFSGDCLFPAGCGRVIEGTYPEMLDSLRRLAALPGETVLLAGHEYTLENLAFALTLEPGNAKVKMREERFRSRLCEQGTPPASLISEEPETNPFLRSGDPRMQKALGMEGSKDAEVFTEARKRKDRFLFP
jgi:hydroxyacylglutathione hydrolase